MQKYSLNSEMIRITEAIITKYFILIAMPRSDSFISIKIVILLV